MNKNNNNNNNNKKNPKRISKNRTRAPKRQTAPVSVGVVTKQNKARIESRGQNLHVIHSEYIGDILGSTSAFDVPLSVAINPGNSQSFPWLSKLATRFESYVFDKLDFRFETTASTATTGYVAMIPDYDPMDAGPASKQDAFQYESAIKVAPWQSCLCHSLKSNLHKRKTYFVRGTVVPEDVALYDTGNLFVCVGGNPSTSQIGELWVDYAVHLMTPQIDRTISGPASFRLDSASGETPAKPFGTDPAFFYYGGPQWAKYDPDLGTLTLQAVGRFICSIRYTGTSLTSASCSISGGGGASTSTVISTVISSGSTSISESYQWTIYKPGAVVTLSASGATTTASIAVVGQLTESTA